MRRCLAVLAILLLTVGCSTTRYSWKSNPPVAETTTRGYEVKISPVCMSHGCDSFVMTVRNLSGSKIEIVWDKTFFINGPQTDGVFVFNGIKFVDRNSSKLNDTVLPNSTFTKRIFPSSLIYYNDGWHHHTMRPAGSYGAYVTLIADGSEVSESITLNLFQQVVSD